MKRTERLRQFSLGLLAWSIVSGAAFADPGPVMLLPAADAEALELLDNTEFQPTTRSLRRGMEFMRRFTPLACAIPGELHLMTDRVELGASSWQMLVKVPSRKLT